MGEPTKLISVHDRRRAGQSLSKGSTSLEGDNSDGSVLVSSIKPRIRATPFHIVPIP